MTDARTVPTHATGLDAWLAGRVLARLGPGAVAVRLWNGTELGSDRPVARLCVHDRSSLWRICADPAVQFGEAYCAGGVTVEGDLPWLLEETFRASTPASARPDLRSVFRRRSRANNRPTSRHNVHHHYDLGNDFYRLWLDREMFYTCAYFPHPATGLEAAQEAKAELVCRKLELQPGQRVVEAGGGWGSLARYMARHYGVQVESYNISTEQIRYARERANRDGLGDRVRFIEDDYRNIRGRFDAFVSVGMLEHVGKPWYRALGDVVDRCLAPEGRALLHTIGRSRPLALNPWIRRRIFPGAYPPTLREMAEILEPNDFAVLDVENLRLHYATTLEHWLRRFEESGDLVRRMFDERFERAWRLYLSGSLAAFRAGTLQLFQVLFTRAGCNRVPLTRRHLQTTDDRVLVEARAHDGEAHVISESEPRRAAS